MHSYIFIHFSFDCAKLCMTTNTSMKIDLILYLARQKQPEL